MEYNIKKLDLAYGLCKPYIAYQFYESYIWLMDSGTQLTMGACQFPYLGICLTMADGLIIDDQFTYQNAQ